MPRRELEICPHCGAKMVKWPLTICKSLVNGLYGLQETTERLGRAVKFGEIPNLSHSAYSKMATLRHWGLISPATLEEGHWHVTDLAYRWLSGLCPLPKRIWTYRNERIADPEGEKNWQVFVWDINEYFRGKADVLAHAHNFSEDQQMRMF